MHEKEKRRKTKNKNKMIMKNRKRTKNQETKPISQRESYILSKITNNIKIK
jgi:hypothetical protein